MPLFRVAGNEIVEYEKDIEAASAEEAEDIFIHSDLDRKDAHSWQWHDTKEITDEQ